MTIDNLNDAVEGAHPISGAIRAIEHPYFNNEEYALKTGLAQMLKVKPFKARKY
jgi:hypothetical protein